MIITPKYLKFDAKGFNGFTVLKDSVIGDDRMTPGYSENIRELDDEKYGLRDPYLQRADFKLSYNLSQNSDVELYTWKELARKAYSARRKKRRFPNSSMGPIFLRMQPKRKQ